MAHAPPHRISTDQVRTIIRRVLAVDHRADLIQYEDPPAWIGEVGRGMEISLEVTNPGTGEGPIWARAELTHPGLGKPLVAHVRIDVRASWRRSELR